MIDFFDLKDESPLSAVLDWNVRIVVEKILQCLLRLDTWLAVKRLLWKIKIGLYKVFYFLYCFAITLGWFLLFWFDFLRAFLLNCFIWGSVLDLKRLCAFWFTEVGKFYGRSIIDHLFLYCVFSTYRFVSWG